MTLLQLLTRALHGGPTMPAHAQPHQDGCPPGTEMCPSCSGTGDAPAGSPLTDCNVCHGMGRLKVVTR